MGGVHSIAPHWGFAIGVPRSPRALPWALTLRTFGAEYKRDSSVALKSVLVESDRLGKSRSVVTGSSVPPSLRRSWTPALQTA